MTSRRIALPALLAIAAASCATGGGVAGDDLVGPTWVAEDIAGRGVIDDLQSHVAFTPDGVVQGHGGCNGFFGNYTLEEGVLSLGPLASTRRACPPAIMDQEQHFHQALGSARGYRVENGLLYLLDADGEALVRLWQRK